MNKSEKYLCKEAYINCSNAPVEMIVGQLFTSDVYNTDSLFSSTELVISSSKTY